MDTEQQFTLPDVGEGLTEAEIIAWHVSVGDVVAVNQMIVEIETAKSIVELPSPYAGEVIRLHVKAGDTVDVGMPIITVSVATGSAREESRSEQAVIESTRSQQVSTSDEPRLLVGYGARELSSNRRRRRAAPAPTSEVGEAPALAVEAAETPKAKPPVRKLAKDLGVALAAVTPTGRGGAITRADVIAASTSNPSVGEDLAAVAPFVETDGVIRIPIKGVRKYAAAAVASSAFTAPHVTEFVTIDISRTMELRSMILARRDFADIKVTPLVLVARALMIAVGRTPEANSRWDEAAQEIVQMREVNLGIAAATPRGLIVPNIKSAQLLSLAGLAASISELAATARAGKTTPADQVQGTITITNIGVFGIDTGTPILNQGEAAILAFGAIRRTPWVVNDAAGERIEPRWTTQLALSFDHRVMDGQQGSQLLADTAALLSEPGFALL